MLRLSRTPDAAVELNASSMRVDIAQALLDIKPSFFRLPGGNNIEASTL